MTDLTFFMEGNPDFINAGRPDIINFDKRRRVAQLISELQLWQQNPYPAWEEKTTSDYVTNIEGLTDKALYKYSLICEPKGGTVGKIKSVV